MALRNMLGDIALEVTAANTETTTSQTMSLLLELLDEQKLTNKYLSILCDDIDFTERDLT